MDWTRRQKEIAGAQAAPAIPEKSNWDEGNLGLRVGLRLAKAEYAVTGLPLATALENFHSLEAFEDVALCCDGAGTFETAVLRHKFWKRGAEPSCPAQMRKTNFAFKSNDIFSCFKWNRR